MLNRKTWLVLALLLFAAAGPGTAQVPQGDADPMIAALQDGDTGVRNMLTAAAEQMSADDYAFRPTEEVRSFGEILAHVAAANYYFCSAATGEDQPVTGVEQERTARHEIMDALNDSFEYCEAAFVTAVDRADTRVVFEGKERSPTAVLMFRNFHALLHYGNVITYMRLRGKVPPCCK